eukprot:TRINITY_DN8016_c0_g1_i1.p1 TRINITY_DN8016_c0_g1~~TRINITY_DN8016_c0_g1_i1.p1  ORF type:complete len:264 (+),score=41.89 TRINITY_DN8016_c0_g1_i1:92-883(+)
MKATRFLCSLMLLSTVAADVTQWCSINADCQPGGSQCVNGACVCDTKGYISLDTTGICVEIDSLPRLNATVEVVFSSSEPCTTVQTISTLVADMSSALMSETGATSVEKVEAICTGTEVWLGAHIHNSRAYSAGPSLASFTAAITGMAFHTILKDPVSISTRHGTSTCVTDPITRAFMLKDTCYTLECKATHNLVGGECVEIQVADSDDGLSGGDACIIIIGVIGGLGLICAIVACCAGSGERIPDEEDEKELSSSSSSDDAK